jgi:hypothetical protein
MLYRGAKCILAALVLLGLAACQTMGGPTEFAAARLQAVGYSRSPTSPSAFVCPATICGGIAAVAFATVNGTEVAPGMTAEDIARGPWLTNQVARQIAIKGLSDGGLKTKVTGVTRLVAGRYPGFTVSGVAASDDGKRVYVRSRVIYIGNAVNAIVSVAETDAQASRGLAAATAE